MTAARRPALPPVAETGDDHRISALENERAILLPFAKEAQAARLITARIREIDGALARLGAKPRLVV